MCCPRPLYNSVLCANAILLKPTGEHNTQSSSRDSSSGNCVTWSRGAHQLTTHHSRLICFQSVSMSRSPECDPSSSAQAAGQEGSWHPKTRTQLSHLCIIPSDYLWNGDGDAVMMGDAPPSASAGPAPLGLNAVTEARGGRAAEKMLSL